MRRAGLSWLLILACAYAAAAQADDAVQVVRRTLQKVAPGQTPEAIGKAPLPGFYQALLEGRMVYVSADGRYVMDGHVYDAQGMADLTAQAMRGVRVKALAGVPVAERIVYAPAHPTYTVTVFTDIDCPYCRALHREIGALNRLGIAVQYLAWPRQGIHKIPSGADTTAYRQAVDVWCAKDRKAAYSAAMQGRLPRGAADCRNPVARQYALGLKIGVDGTPTVIAGDGRVLGGYLRPGQMLRKLRQGAGAGEAPAATD